MIIILNRIFILILLFLFMTLSCSNKSLSYFFDGVSASDSSKPGPDQQYSNTSADSSDQKITKETAMVEGARVYHPDYKQKKCEKCHQVEHGYRLKQRQPELCYQCHKNINEQYNKIHGPVAAGFCSTCHEPHKSEFVALLKMPIRNICQHCHEPGDVNKNEAHQKLSKTECLDCHHPHGGETVNLLRTNKDG